VSPRLKQNSLPARERIKSERESELLFKKGLSASGMRLWIKCYAYNSACPEIKILVSVPKKNFKRAIDRNLIKRRIREAFRQNKSDFYSYIPSGKGLLVGLIYKHAEMGNFSEITHDLRVYLPPLLRRTAHEKNSEKI
jgi:ribonuclease P protein component